MILNNHINKSLLFAIKVLVYLG